MTQIQSNKQDIGQMNKKLKLDVNEYRNNDPSSNRISSRWNNEEVMLAIQGIIIKYNYIQYYHNCVLQIRYRLLTASLLFSILLIT